MLIEITTHLQYYNAKSIADSMNGIFAVDKPKGLTSSHVVQTIKEIFQKLRVFAEDIEKAKQKRRADLATSNLTKKRIERKIRETTIKIGHGGTLDPLASGILIIGVGSGTKQLQYYLGECTKTYEAKAMLGQSTTSGDRDGEVITRAEYEHVTLELLRNAAKKFVGKSQQTAPLFSALKVDGKPLYEYARKGLPLPKSLKTRDIQINLFAVHDLGFDDQYKPMELSQDSEGKVVANMLAQNSTMDASPMFFSEEFTSDSSVPDSEKNTAVLPRLVAPETPARDQLPVTTATAEVGSGTYIRSLMSDLARSVECAAHLVELKRTKQSDWELGKNVFRFADFSRDEDVWGPLLKAVLDNGPLYDLQAELEKLPEQQEEESDENAQKKRKLE